MYNNTNKRKWREQIVKRTLRRINKPRDQIRGAYLIGDFDLEGDAWKAAGLNRKNLIGVDRENECVKVCRKKGGIAVEGDLQHLILAMQKESPLEFLSIDLMANYSRSSKELACLLCCTSAVRKSTVVSINLLAGRDPCAINDAIQLGMPRGGTPHRGALIHCVIMGFVATKMLEYGFFEDSADFYLNHCYKESKPEFLSYVSEDSGQRFDSVLFTWPFDFGEDDGGNAPRIQQPTSGNKQAAKISRKLAAAKALRTIALRRQRNPCPRNRTLKRSG